MVATGYHPFLPRLKQLVTWGANFAPLSLGPQPWRVLASNYVHIGLIHIFFNMWCLWNLGRLAERIFDRWTYMLIYTASGIGGSLAKSLVASARHRSGSFGSNLRACRRVDRRTVFGEPSNFEGSTETHAEKSDQLRGVQLVFRPGARHRQCSPSWWFGNWVRAGSSPGKELLGTTGKQGPLAQLRHGSNCSAPLRRIQTSSSREQRIDVGIRNLNM